MTKVEQILSFVGLWVARIIAGFLIFVGAQYMLGGIDPMIRYTASGVVTFYLLKEIL
jgi:hypothetical protein